MRIILFTVIILLAMSCTEKYYFKKSLNDIEKSSLNRNDSLVKTFEGKTTWGVGQIWKGKLVVKKTNRSFDIRQIDEWQEISDDGNHLYSISHFDNYGYLQDEKVYGTSETPEVETICKRDSLDSKILRCKTIWKYHDTLTIRLKSNSVMKDGRSYKHGVLYNDGKSRKDGRVQNE